MHVLRTVRLSSQQALPGKLTPLGADAFTTQDIISLDVCPSASIRGISASLNRAASGIHREVDLCASRHSD